ncbi:MAG: cytochrome ubiquinol oxidase subunit I [Alloprevotella sp.]
MLEVASSQGLDWSRAQFALTACYHWLFVPLTLGLALVMGIMETIYYRTKEEFWKKTTQFWQKLFGINFAIGVATGLILEFEFGTNWSNYSWFVGDIFGAPLAIEGIVAFFMEATFIAVMFFGWNKVSRRFHLASTWLTGLGATLSAWWILVANSWMQHPVGMDFNPETVRNEMMDFFAVAFSPAAVNKFCHTVTSSWMTGAVFVVGVSCWYLLRGRNKKMALASIKVGATVGVVSALLVLFTGDRSGIEMAENQPMKLAAAEGLEKGGKGAAFSIVPGVEVPGVLSILATHDINGYVPGTQDILDGYTYEKDGQTITVRGAKERMASGKIALQAFKDFREAHEKGDQKAKNEARQTFEQHKADFGYGYIDKAEDLIPPTGLVYWSFRVMVGCGSLLLLILIGLWWQQRRGKLEQSKLLLHAGLWSIPLVYAAGQAGWIVAEVGRQPWAIQDLLPVNAAISGISAGAVQTTFFIFLSIFTVLLACEVRILCRAIKGHNAE